MQDQRQAIFGGELVELIAKDAFDFIQIDDGRGVAVVSVHLLHDAVAFFANLAAGFGSLDIQRQPLGDLLEPGGQVLNAVFGFGFYGKGKEDGLGGVFGVVSVAKDLVADIEDHARVTAHNLLERFLRTGPHKIPEKLLALLARAGP